MRSLARIRALDSAYILTSLAFFWMQDYLTSVWKLSYTHAAGILNIWTGVSMILPVFFHTAADTLFGNFKILLISSITYSVGIGFVTMSTPPILAKATGTCKTYVPECIGQAQRVLFYIGMAMVATGIAGNCNNFVGAFREEQKEKKPNDNRGNNQTDIEENTTECSYFDPIRSCCQVPGAVILMVAAIVGAFALPFVKPWKLRFGIPAIFTVFATVFFATGWKCYRRVEPKGSPVTNVCRVFAAAAFKLSQPFPPSSEDYYKKEGEQVTDFSPTHLLRRLHKAAIIVYGDLSEDKKAKKRWRLCTVEEVEDAKIALRLVPMWMTLIVFGMVASTQGTYFVEQASTMDRKLGKIKMPPQILLLAQWSASQLFGWCANALLKCRWKGTPAIGIGVAMISSVLCCIAAAVTETERLKVLRRHGPGGDIPMSMFWLLFQFILIASMKSFMLKSVAAFYYDQSPRSVEKAPPELVKNLSNTSATAREATVRNRKWPPLLRRVCSMFREPQVENRSTTNYIKEFTNGVCGLGYMCSVLSVHVVGKVSEVGGGASWFQPSLNQSHLDRYFWVLATLCSLNLVVFIFVASHYTYHRRQDEAAADGEPSDLNTEITI